MKFHGKSIWSVTPVVHWWYYYDNSIYSWTFHFKPNCFHSNGTLLKWIESKVVLLKCCNWWKHSQRMKAKKKAMDVLRYLVRCSLYYYTGAFFFIIALLKLNILRVPWEKCIMYQYVICFVLKIYDNGRSGMC